MPEPFKMPLSPSFGPVAAYQPFRGVDWSNSLHRPGCQDHLQHPSRRGDNRVMHTGPIGMRSAAKDIHRDQR